MNRAQIDVVMILRIIAFIVGLFSFVSGLIDLGMLSSLEVFIGVSTAGTALLKIIFGVFLMVLGIIPEAVGMVIRVIIRG